jgi:hypothetical protein
VDSGGSDNTPNKARGTAVYSYPQPWVFFGKVTGHYRADMVDDYIAAMERTLDRGQPISGFHDWSGMPNYDTVCRKRLTDWVLKHMAHTAGHHILVQSKLVAMGVSTANMLLGGSIITSYTDRAAFEQALARAK